MADFTSLPAELRYTIYALARPESITVAIKEGIDLEITSISPPPALLLTSKESRSEAQKWDLKPYSFLIGDNYTDFLFSEDMTLRFNITPSTAEHLSITWTELYTVLGDALLDAKRVEIECSEPWRLARLFMLPEAEIVGVGVSCVEQGLYGSEIVASDRDTREALCPEIVVCVGKEEYVLEEELVEGFFGEKAFVAKGFRKRSADADRLESVEAEEQDAEVELRSVEEKDSGEEREETAKGSWEQLTEGTLERFCIEFEKLFPMAALQRAQRYTNATPTLIAHFAGCQQAPKDTRIPHAVAKYLSQAKPDPVCIS